MANVRARLGNLAPLVARAQADGAVIHALLLTHTHEDHVAGVTDLRDRGMPVLAHPHAPGGFHDAGISPGEVVRFGLANASRASV